MVAAEGLPALTPGLLAWARDAADRLMAQVAPLVEQRSVAAQRRKGRPAGAGGGGDGKARRSRQAKEEGHS